MAISLNTSIELIDRYINTILVYVREHRSPNTEAQKLIAKLILASSKPGDFDPFFGSGTTCVVAKKLRRKYSGVEQESEYCQMAAKRINRAKIDKSIQGYHDGYFWECNSLADQMRVNPTNKK